MHILYAVHFNSPRGGLHENVFSTVIHSLKMGCKTTVICREGEFAERLIEKGSRVITTDYGSIEDTTERVINAKESDYDVIHTHPGPSRKVALSVAEKLDLPIVMTFHGMWQDSLPRYSGKLSAIFPVSEGVKDFLKTKLDDDYEKFMIMPNGVNKTLFKPKRLGLGRKNDKLNISLITRLDKDKDFIIQLFYEALKFTSEKYTEKVKWTIVGDGSERELMETMSDSITKQKQIVEFVGWKQGKELLRNYQDSDIVIAPGRCALEAMSCGKPVIAIGSKKYNGLITQDNWTKGVYTNFGGFGNKMDDYMKGSIEKDLESVILDEKLRSNLGKMGVTITDLYYNEDDINNKIFGVYNIIKKEKQTIRDSVGKTTYLV